MLRFFFLIDIISRLNQQTHPYTNNIAYIVVEKLHFGDWYLNFFISLVLLQGVLFIKQKFENKGIFRYV